MALLSLLEVGVTLVVEISTAIALGIVVANLTAMQKDAQRAAVRAKMCTQWEKKIGPSKTHPKSVRPEKTGISHHNTATVV